VTTAKYRALRASGRCVKCEQPSPKPCCARCTSVSVETQRARRTRLRAAGLCSLCEGPGDAQRYVCGGCREYLNQQRRDRYARKVARPVHTYRRRAPDAAPLPTAIVVQRRAA
jgi:hypothetical protein